MVLTFGIRAAFFYGWSGCAKLPFIQVNELSLLGNRRRLDWSLKSSADGAGFDPLTNSGDGRTRLLKTIKSLQRRLDARIKELKKDLPRKLLFFLVGFYCATAFATFIGQTGDWDILSAGVAVAVVEGIGALMYKISISSPNGIRSLVVWFNYWKAGLTLGLFLDSFKY
ncbi:uncharacterized protein ycf20 [Silene latifolia]|uniref:uncharacterized protein ycf20 n=1 Tax=Silene latifolia TaxID=37657 RepID=UPI003D778CAC